MSGSAGMDLLQKRIVWSLAPTGTSEDSPAAFGPVDFNATGDVFGFAPSVPIDVYRFGILTVTAMDPDAGGFALALDHRPIAGADTNRTEKDQLRRADAQTVAAGKIVYRDVVIPVAQAAGDDALGGATVQTSLVNVGPSGPLHVRPGEEVVLEVTNAVGAASTGRVFIEYAELGHALPSTVSTSDGVNVIKDTTA